MTRLRRKSEEIREYILGIVEKDPKMAVILTMQKFNITRQAVHQHINHLIKQGVLFRIRSGHYELSPLEEWSTTISVSDNPHEDVVWRNEIAPRIGNLPDNAIDVWSYGFTEMYNNVVDHSDSATAIISIKKNAYTTEMMLLDYGIGIFYKIQKALNLLDERHAVLELTKGKLTTDPTSHSGEGIFFTSRMFDTFEILSGDVFLSHKYGDDEDWILESRRHSSGTCIFMKLKNNTSRTKSEIFKKFTSGEDINFSKTIVPVRLAQYGDEKLISRSQAKRLLERVDRFKTVLLDFTEVKSIGQAFADEVFRVFINQHPQIEIVPINTNNDVSGMIKRVQQAE